MVLSAGGGYCNGRYKLLLYSCKSFAQISGAGRPVETYALNLWPGLSFDRFLRLKTGYEQVLAEGHKDWYGVGKASKNEFRDAARQAWQEGLVSLKNTWDFMRRLMAVITGIIYDGQQYEAVLRTPAHKPGKEFTRTMHYLLS